MYYRRRLATGHSSPPTSHTFIRKASASTLELQQAGGGEGGEEKLVKSEIIPELETIDTGAPSLRRIQNEAPSGRCFMTKQQLVSNIQHRDRDRHRHNFTEQPQVLAV